MFVFFIIILSRSQQFPTSSSQNQVELGEWATGHFMHCGYGLIDQKLIKLMQLRLSVEDKLISIITM